MRVLQKLAPDAGGVVPLLGLNSLDDILDKPVNDVREAVEVSLFVAQTFHMLPFTAILTHYSREEHAGCGLGDGRATA